MPHAPRSARECEGIGPHTPKGTPILGVGMDSWMFKENDCRGQNIMDWNFFYIIEKLLKCKCLKWVRMIHLDIWNTSYGQKKSRESNWQFDSWPLKVKNRPDFLTCKKHATRHWRALDEGYNFASDLISIRCMYAKLWAPKVVGVLNVEISGLPLRFPKWWLPPSPGRDESCESKLPMACPNTKSAPTMQ